MIMMGVIYFALAVSIDSYKLSKYKKKDKNSATWFPKYLEPDNDV